MFVSTFYSYKGGVGRTFALVNVAVELAKTGRSVLLVDFDLEAPGLDTFALLKSDSKVGGIVQFVSDYIDKKTPPRVADYIFEAPISSSDEFGEINGRIWVMPAGRRDANYDRLLSGIHWQQLYSEMEGFYLFEDLRSQWASEFAPDYVLVDSRTGHTDVGGICTRQLADLVVILFTPNEQNLEGLPPIVRAIRMESESSPDRRIETCFVASNVPTLDDEEGILRRLMSRFARAFSVERSPVRILTVQRYDSLQLLNQDVFTLVRPKSRLAKQYKEIFRFIVECNLNDRRGVLEHLKRQVGQGHARNLDQDTRRDKILARYSSDPEVLLWVARCYPFQFSPAEAIRILKKAESVVQPDTPTIEAAVHLDLADAYLKKQQVEEASSHLKHVASVGPLELDEIRTLMQLWQMADIPPTAQLVDCFNRAQISADDLDFLILSISESREWQWFVSQVLLKDGLEAMRGHAERLHALLLSLMGSRQFELLPKVSAVLLEEDGNALETLFNTAMAEWAFTGAPAKRAFEKFATALEGVDERIDANFSQCVAVACGVLGATDSATKHLEAAFEKNQRVPTSKFSCWRYTKVTQEEFETDLNEIRLFVETGQPNPLFLRDAE